MSSSTKLRLAPACYHILHMIPPMVAREMNFFEEEGLVDEDGREAYEFILGGLAPFTYEKETLQQAIKEKGVDVTMDVHPSTVAHTRLSDSGLPKLTIIAGWRNNNPNCLLARGEIKSLGDLAGKRIGCIDEKDNLVGALSPALKEEGVDPHGDVEWVRGYAPQKGTKALRDGIVDAAFIPTIDVATLVNEGYNNLFNIVERYPQGRPDRIILATQQAIEDRRDALKSFLKGMLRAYWFVRHQPENYQYLRNLEIRLRRDSHDPDERTRPLVNGSPQHSEILPFPYDAIPTGMDEYLAESVALGELPSAPPASTLTDLTILEEAFAELAERSDVRADLQRAKATYDKWGF